MTTDELRVKFEAHCAKYARNLSLRRHPERGYWYEETRQAWELWQSSYASRDAEVEALRKYSYTLTARLCAISVVGEKDGYELIRRESVMRFVVEWREAIDAAMREEPK